MTVDQHDDELTVEDRFSIVPEWVIDADISDRAVRLYALLLRYGNTSGARMPGRTTLSKRLRGCSTDSLDRAVAELEQLGALEVTRDTSTIAQRRAEGRGYANNRYHVRTSKPQRHGRPDDDTPASATDPGTVGTSSADRRSKPQRHGQPASPETTPDLAACTRLPSRVHAATPSRVHAATCTESFYTDRKPSPPTPRPESAVGQWADNLTTEAGVADWRILFDNRRDLDEFCSELRVLRRQHDLLTTRWTGQAIRRAIAAALAEGYEAGVVLPALRAMAVDAVTDLPGRLAHPGPWWDLAEAHDLTRRRDAKAAQALKAQREQAARRASCDCEFGWRWVSQDGHEKAQRCATCHPRQGGTSTSRSHSA